MPAATTAASPAPTASAARLPAYDLYGHAHRDAAWGGAPDRLHVESIAERGQLYDWEIRPHRHEVLFQLLVVQRGRAEAALDGRTLTLRGPAVITVPALAAHGFRFTPAIVGWVFTVAEAHLAALLQPHAALKTALMRVAGHPLHAPQEVLQAAAALRAEAARAQAPWRAAALDAALLRLAVAVARARPHEPPHAAEGDRAATPPLRALAHVGRLRELVERQYRQQPSQAALAAQLGITPTQLNRACRQVLGHPALGVLHARLLLQAQRELAYTLLPIKRVAFELGFKDAAYFTRFFTRLAGQTPAAWRASVIRHNSP